MTTSVQPAETRASDPIVADALPSLRRRLLVPTLVLSGSLMAVVSSLGAPLIPTLSRTDGVSLSTGEWILTITLLTGALATPVMGRLADGTRQRAVILVALAAVVVGCVVSAVSNGFTVLIIGRGLQGLGLGLLPVAMAIARRNLPPEKSRRTIATLSVTTAIGAGLGYPVTGLIAQVLNFRAAYWFGAITVGGALVIAALVLPHRSAGTSRHFDVVGAALLSLVVIGVSVVLSEGGGWGWTSARSLGVVAASVVLLAVWIPFELRVAHPLVDLRQVRNRSVLTADVSGFLISIALYLLLPVIVEFVQIPLSAGYGFAASLVVSGLVLIPLSVGSFVASRLLTVYERRFGPRTMIPLGSVVFALSAMFFALEHSSLWEAFVTTGIAGLGVGFTSGAMPGFIVRAVAQSETGSATGFYQVVRSIGLTVGSALAAAVLMAHTRHGQTLPDVDGFVVALIIAATLCLVSAVVSFVLPGRARSLPNALTVGDERDLEVMRKGEAELGGIGLVPGEEPLSSGSEGDRL
jgi:MFS family permease